MASLLLGALLFPALNAAQSQSYSYSQPSLTLPIGTADVILSTLHTSAEPSATGLAGNFAKIVGNNGAGGSKGTNSAFGALDVPEDDQDGVPNVDLGTTSASDDLFGAGSSGLAGKTDTEDGGNGPIFDNSDNSEDFDDSEDDQNTQRPDLATDNSDGSNDGMMEMMNMMDMMTKNRRRITRRAAFDNSEVPASGGFKDFHWPSPKNSPAFRQYDPDNSPDDSDYDPPSGSAQPLAAPAKSPAGPPSPSAKSPAWGKSPPPGAAKSPKGKGPGGPPPWDKSYPYEETTDHPYDSPYDQNTDYPDNDADDLPAWLWQAKRAKEAKGQTPSPVAKATGGPGQFPSDRYYPAPRKSTSRRYKSSSTSSKSYYYKPSSTTKDYTWTTKTTGDTYYSPTATWTTGGDYTGYSPVGTSWDKGSTSKWTKSHKSTTKTRSTWSKKPTTTTPSKTTSPTTKKTPTPKTKYTPGRYSTTLATSPSSSTVPQLTASPTGKDWTGNTLDQVCPQSCDWTGGKNMCDTSTSCTVVTTGKTYCTCRAGFKADGRNDKDFSSQFRWAGQPYVMVGPGIVCNTQCQDNLCSEVPERSACK